MTKNNNDNLHIHVNTGKTRGKRGNGKISSMVIVSKGDVVKKVRRNTAEELVSKQNYTYAKRSLWKSQIRDKQGFKEEAIVQQEVPKKKKKLKTDKNRKSKEEKAG